MHIKNSVSEMLFEAKEEREKKEAEKVLIKVVWFLVACLVSFAIGFIIH